MSESKKLPHAPTSKIVQVLQYDRQRDLDNDFKHIVVLCEDGSLWENKRNHYRNSRWEIIIEPFDGVIYKDVPLPNND